MKAKIENFVAWLIVCALLAFGFVLFVVFGSKKRGREVFSSANNYVMQWSEKHHWVMYWFGLLLFCCGVFCSVVAALALFDRGLPLWQVITAVSLGGALIQIGVWEMVSAAFRKK